MTIPELVEAYAKLQYQKEELEATEKMIKEELQEYLTAQKLDAQVINGWSVSRVNRTSFKTDLEFARSLGAVKETVDEPKLRQLDKAGVEIPGKNVTTYILIKNVSENE